MDQGENISLLPAQINTGEIVLYQPNDQLSLEVKLENETVWLTQQQMAVLFDVKENNITYHIQSVFKTHELDPEATTQKIRVVRKEGNRQVSRNIDFYNLDMIISVGYRVNSANATQFRRWATSVLKEYMLKGYAVNQRLIAMEERIDRRLAQHENVLQEHQEKIDFFVRTNLPPVEQVFFEGEFFEAHNASLSAGLIETHLWSKPSHDRWLIIDDSLYHCGHSLKDMGRKLSAITLMGTSPETILGQIR